MFQIRPDQMQAFDDKASRLFEDEMLEYFQAFAPKLCEVAKEKRVRKVIHLGMQNAESHGFTNRGPVRFYLELMFCFGCYFDTDPQHKWAHRYLNGNEASQTERSDQLFEAYKSFSKKCMGEKNALLMEAIGEDVDPKSLVSAEGDTRTEITTAIEKLYPERASAIGPKSLGQLVDSAIDTTQKYDAKAKTSQLIAAGLAVLIGHRFDRDRLYPWIGRTLNPKSEVDPDKRFERVFEKSQIYVGEVIQYWEGQ